MKKKTVPLENEQIISLSIKLGYHNCKNEEIWSGILQDFELQIDSGKANILDIYYIMRSLAAVNMLEESVTKGLLDYLLKKRLDH